MKEIIRRLFHFSCFTRPKFTSVVKSSDTKIRASRLFETGEYQAGFKAGTSCGTGHARVLAAISECNCRRKKNRNIFTLIDIAAAYDSVRRHRLWKLIDDKLDRARSTSQS